MLGAVSRAIDRFRGSGQAAITVPPLDGLDLPALRLLILVVLYALPAVVTLRPVGQPVYDPDIWWHLRTGQWVVEHGTVPQTDPFSRLERPWVASNRLATNSNSAIASLL